MKIKFIYRLYAIIFLAANLTLFSCAEWTEPENLDLLYPSFEEQKPQLYADYIKDLKNYKSGDHKLIFVSFENLPVNPVKQGERLTTVPDSVDFISLNNPFDIAPETQQEMIKVREKGTRILYSIDYAIIESTWKDMQKENPELTEKEALEYIDEQTNIMLELCDKFNFDGITIDYTGRSLVSLTEPALAQYNARQQKFFNRILDWQNNHTEKLLVFYGNVQYLVPENMNILHKFNFIMLKSVLSSNADQLTLNAYLALQSGEDAVNNGEYDTNPVPNDRFLACVQLPQADDKDKIIGYWNTIVDGNKTIAALGSAQWTVQKSLDFSRNGIFILNADKDYYNNTYAYIREAIQIMNPIK